MHDRHACDCTVFLQRDRVHSVIRADDHGDVGVLEIIVDLVHLQYNWDIDKHLHT